MLIGCRRIRLPQRCGRRQRDRRAVEEERPSSIAERDTDLAEVLADPQGEFQDELQRQALASPGIGSGILRKSVLSHTLLVGQQIARKLDNV